MAEGELGTEAKKVGSFLTKDFHGLPVWAWGAVGIAGVVGGLWLRNRTSQQASPAVDLSSTGAIPPPDTGTGGGGTTGTTTTTTTTTNPPAPSYPTDAGGAGSYPGGANGVITSAVGGLKQAVSGLKTSAHGSISHATGGKLAPPAPRSIKSALHNVSAGVYKPTSGGPVGGYEQLPDGSWLVAPSGFQPFGWTCYWQNVTPGGSPSWVCVQDS